MIPEGIIDKRIEQAVEWASVSQTYAKYAAIATAQVGDYSGATEQIAERARRGSSTVYNWAHAFNLYKLLRTEHRQVSRKLWRELPISFWWIAAAFQANGYEAIHYLLSAYQHGWSTRDMRMEYDRDREAGTAPLQFRRIVITMRGLADELAKRKALLNDEQNAAVIAFRKAFQ